MELNAIQNLMILSKHLEENIADLASTSHHGTQILIKKVTDNEIRDLNNEIKYLHEYLKVIKDHIGMKLKQR